ncbi:MAG TPA: hypothetical protein VMT66_03530 [Steroidobacteraceae bacterium]|nr:hypothetical protein [Steroidobacteraceae bacterium]
MKIAITLALAGAAASGAAQAQLIANTPETAGGSDLVLFVSDLTTGAYFIQDLANPLDSIYSKAQVITDGVLTSPGHFNTPTAGVAGSDSALKTFLSGLNTGSDTIQYSFMASDATNSGSFKLGQQRFLTTSTLDLSGGNPIGSTTAFSNSFTSQANVNFDGFVTWINNNCTTNVCTSGWGDSTLLGQQSGGKLAPNSWVSASYANGASLGTASTMYLLATSGGGASPVSNSYIGGMVNVGKDGTITVTNAGAVPLPAAVWLFGSGLLGLVGLGRRRAVAA